MCTQVKTIHCFEAAGLGKAPFRYVGIVHQEISYGQRVIGSAGGVAITTKPGGTCDYCGTYIVNMFTIESADGNRFKVGCDCIEKTGDAGLMKKVKSEINAAKRLRRREQRIAQEKADRELCETFDLNALSHLDHPTPERAACGETMADWARWMRANKYWNKLAATIRRVTK